MFHRHRLLNVVTLGVLALGLVGVMHEVQAAGGNTPKAAPAPAPAPKPAATPKPAPPEPMPSVWKAGDYKNLSLVGIKDRSEGVYVPPAYDKDPKAMLPLVWFVSTRDTTNYNINKWAESRDAIVVYPHNGVSGTSAETLQLLKAELNSLNSLRYDRNKVYILGMDTAGSSALLAATTVSRGGAGMLLMGAVGDQALPPQTPIVLLPQETDMDKSLSNLMDRALHQQNPLWFRKVLDSAITSIGQMPMYLDWLMEANAACGATSLPPAREAAKTRLLKRIELVMKVSKSETLDLEVHQLLGIPVIAALPEGKNLAAYWYKAAFEEANKLEDKVERYHHLVDLVNDQITVTLVDRDTRVPLQNAISDLLKEKSVRDDADSGQAYQRAFNEENQARKEKDKMKCINRLRYAQSMYDSIAQRYQDTMPGRSALISSERLKAEIPTLLTPAK
ncbi:MAG: hypothetical protein WCI73_09120 [Phycisphaerae bacterium]